ncbi:MAG TPA: 16S rRNA (cytosine(1402)-N(4))-methyltransferase [Candidatus Margulisbacteria bacterium]|nr:MAG: 16S rRNA (cytosine(1402)-N(4))-methyltransferase [Candidatus Margulisbacteria bacterium GWF2_38_17]OGI11229.1 MAG: 16S rRNA (cytosine(1402)-N(4))-methyltransferase [Candidatus Margulisbacteria bacterium GWE2_39_32]HCT85886.1 16S rRNA (cytosine(1402)-N(4))-methyltransferase [Candidatus Margulisiibacteriota bacterium]
MNLGHNPVLLRSAVEMLSVNPHGVYVDGTLGGSGHAQLIFSSLADNGVLVGIDKDNEAIAYATTIFTGKKNVIIVKDSFANIKKVLFDNSIAKIDGVILDLGMSSYQIDTAERGFSYISNAKLDMRMDITQLVTAKTVINEYSTEQLVRIFYEYGEEPAGMKIVREIVKTRQKQMIENTGELVAIIRKVLGQGTRGMTAIKRVFQAIRIDVNKELDDLKTFLHDVTDLLNPGGRIVIITFHSLEDRIVKSFFREMAIVCTCPPSFPKCICGQQPVLKLITKKPIVPDEEEIQANIRAKSAKLRVAERL